jgi:hypothetical protein
MSGGFFAKLTPEQQQAALEYRGPENIGGQTMTRTFTDEELDALAVTLRAASNHPHNQHGPHEFLDDAADAIAFLLAERAAVRADATRELVEALEEIVILSDDYHRAVPIAQAALEKARGRG